MNTHSRNPRRPFLALELALETVALAKPYVERVRRHDREVHDQTKRALTRCVLALAEGSQREGGNRQLAYRRARGEANEALAAIRLAVVWGYLPEQDVIPLLRKMDHLVAMLVRLTR